MRNTDILLKEVVFLGILSVVFCGIIYYALQGSLPDRNDTHFARMILGWFLLLPIVHITLEVLGLNEKWCRANY
jgi:hypothetical protein